MKKEKERISFYYGRISPGVIALSLGVAGLYFGAPETPVQLSRWFLGFLVLTGLTIIFGAIVSPFEPADSSNSSKKDERDILAKDHITMKEKNLLAIEYGLSQGMHNYYGRITWEISGILVGGAVAGLALSFNIANSALSAISVSSVGVLVIAFYLLIRRHSRVAELHLVRCRDIERRLGLGQHLLVKRGTSPGGVWVEGKLIRVPGPTGWQITQILVFGLVLVALGLAVFRLVSS